WNAHHAPPWRARSHEGHRGGSGGCRRRHGGCPRWRRNRSPRSGWSCPAHWHRGTHSPRGRVPRGFPSRTGSRPVASGKRTSGLPSDRNDVQEEMILEKGTRGHVSLREPTADGQPAAESPGSGADLVTLWPPNCLRSAATTFIAG